MFLDLDGREKMTIIDGAAAGFEIVIFSHKVFTLIFANVIIRPSGCLPDLILDLLTVLCFGQIREYCLPGIHLSVTVCNTV